ncbi:glycoside hydrolase family 27 protein [Kitasatospora sp. NBC_00240]|uniref:glycoside hydrolase family 27 protein n=1 Tax=Kitasatospora sp. NBC_00240 TaxID=2903567 RepID=UPI00225BEA5D|nr:glycoside hydrolase family 27 protein [Kitasatospora sp. NBC_00240]MCX5208369.1 glycoside hydrolase family 27 protein [Kitasatospora sp. NBC_00240]
MRSSRLTASLATVMVAASTVIATVGTSPAVAVTVPGNIADHTLQATPPMVVRPGSWRETNETLVKQDADALVSTGLAAKGWNVVAVDDDWMIKSNGQDWDGTQIVSSAQKGRDLDGNIITAPSKYPSGIKSVIDYVHSKGLKFGIYNDAGTLTCDGGAGSYGHFAQDANYFASLGVDYIKSDYCYNYDNTSNGWPLTTDHDADIAVAAYQEFARAIKAANASYGTHMVLNASAPAYFNWHSDATGTDAYKKVVAGMQTSAQAWRAGVDTGGTWSASLSQLDQGEGARQFAKAGHFNDLDQLSFGKGTMTRAQEQAQFTMWAMVDSPLNMKLKGTAAFTANIVADAGNTDVIAVSQDRLGVQGRRISTSADADVYVKPLANGDFAVTLLNKNTTTARTISTTGSAIGTSATGLTLKDLWTKATTSSTGTISATVPAGSAVIYRVTPGSTFTGWTKARNATAISDEDAVTAGCFDRVCDSYSADRLAAAGAHRGDVLSFGGSAFQWPGVGSGEPDSIVAKGQTITHVVGNKLAFLGSSSGGDTSGTLTINYTDGTSSTATLGFPNWVTSNPTAFGCSTAVDTTGRNAPTGPDQPSTHYVVSYCPITVTAGKTIKSFTLPDKPALHIFSVNAS